MCHFCFSINFIERTTGIYIETMYVYMDVCGIYGTIYRQLAVRRAAGASPPRCEEITHWKFKFAEIRRIRTKNGILKLNFFGFSVEEHCVETRSLYIVSSEPSKAPRNFTPALENYMIKFIIDIYYIPIIFL